MYKLKYTYTSIEDTGQLTVVVDLYNVLVVQCCMMCILYIYVIRTSIYYFLYLLFHMLTRMCTTIVCNFVNLINDEILLYCNNTIFRLKLSWT